MILTDELQLACKKNIESVHVTCFRRGFPRAHVKLDDSR